MSLDVKLGEVERGVLKVLKMDPHIADGPKYRQLVLWYWTHIDKVFTHDRESGYYYTDMQRFTEATSPEAITRSLRRLIEKELIKIGIETKIRRNRLEEMYREKYGKFPKR